MEITDPRAIRALAHPLRLDLLDLLVAIGPATAAQCGRILGVPQANCSFHLRQLAKYGFVEDAGSGADRRERQWRVPDPRLRFPGGEGRVAESSLQQVLLPRVMQTIADFTERLDAEPQQWQDAATVMSGVALLTAAEATALKEQWSALLAPYLARAVGSGLHPGPGQRHVRYFLAGTPLPVRPSTPEEAGDEPGD